MLSNAMQVQGQYMSQKSFLVPSIGLSAVGEDILDGRRYNARLFSLQQGLNLTPQRWQFPLVLQLETHIALNNITTGGNRDFEIAGVSGLSTHITFRNGWRLAPSVMSGPGFISASTLKQRRGFLFSNHLCLALFIPAGAKGLVIKPEVRYRHMSNAGLASPNVGLDNLFFMIGIGKQRLAAQPPE